MKIFQAGRRDRGGRVAGSPLAQATALMQSGRYAAAEAEARAVARARDWRKGDEVGPVALSIAALAMVAQGRHAEALGVYDELLPVFGEIFGAEYAQTLKLRSDRAQNLIALARYAEAEAECAAVGRVAARGTGPGVELVTAAARNGLVYALNAQERHSEAEAAAREALADLAAPSRLALVLRLGLARSLNGQSRHEEALTEAEHADKVRRGLPEVQASRLETGAVELTVANALLGLGRTGDARTRAAVAHADCLAAFGPDHYRTAEARTLLARIDTA